MTVKDLIAILSELKPDLHVYVWPYDGQGCDFPLEREGVKVDDKGVTLEGV